VRASCVDGNTALGAHNDLDVDAPDGSGALGELCTAYVYADGWRCVGFSLTY